ncbi:pantothenate kinase [Babesia ovata]|uniref:Pantothenate kinase n=1 Tax=Babesia ovata TaxID=189622 RepID=A0A2H6KC51_9APIC|nr:pantothenate kinase [Babesia ovata]GBE60573.1 pantothenate kinase [Babesia ovata]
MGNVIGVDCSYASKNLIDRIFITVGCDSDEECRHADEFVARNSFVSLHIADNKVARSDSREYRFLSVPATHADATAHLASRYRRNIRRVTICGNVSASLLHTLESLFPDAIITEREHEACLHFGASLFVSSPGGVVAVNGDPPSPKPFDITATNGHMHAAVHSGASYKIIPSKDSHKNHVWHSVIGFSAVTHLYNMFISRYGLSENSVRTEMTEIAELAVHGTSNSCDMLVRNAYGGGCADIGLSGDTLAASFGMLHKDPSLWECANEDGSECMHVGSDGDETDDGQSNGSGVRADTAPSECCALPVASEVTNKPLSPYPRHVPKKEDVAHSLVKMLIISVTNHAILHAQLNGIDTVIFSGIIFENDSLCGLAKPYVDRWSKGSMEMLVCRNSTFLASTGAVELSDALDS